MIIMASRKEHWPMFMDIYKITKKQVNIQPFLNKNWLQHDQITKRIFKEYLMVTNPGYKPVSRL